MGNPRAIPFAFRASLRPTSMVMNFNSPKPFLVSKLSTQPRASLATGYLSTKRFSSCISSNADEGRRNPLPWLKNGRKNVERTKVVNSSWQISAEKLLKESTLQQSGNESGSKVDADADDEVDNPRWSGIRNKFSKWNREKPGIEKPEIRKWNKQEAWGRNVWKEAKESTVPKMVGEGLYGVGPVLAALSAGRREFYALYVQEGMDVTANNKRKKDKKGVEKIMKIAEKMELTLREVSKHDLNMISDNRPHQGLVLDASPLEMVGIKELEPVSGDGERGPLWLALDEVTDPQNLGAIIRSAYFFGASGVVLCAKNSAPLSGVVSKASAGSLELMEIRSCRNMMQFLSLSAGNKWRVLGASVSSRAIPLSEVVPGAPTILVLGSEGTGLRPLVERSCTDLIRIPGNQPVEMVVDEVENGDQEFRSFMAVESLNVSVAAGVLLNHLIGMK